MLRATKEPQGPQALATSPLFGKKGNSGVWILKQKAHYLTKGNIYEAFKDKNMLGARHCA